MKPRGKGRISQKPETYAYCPKCQTHSPKVIVVKDLSINKMELWCYLTCAHIVISEFPVTKDKVIETWHEPGSGQYEMITHLMKVQDAIEGME